MRVAGQQTGSPGSLTVSEGNTGVHTGMCALVLCAGSVCAACFPWRNSTLVSLEG